MSSTLSSYASTACSYISSAYFYTKGLSNPHIDRKYPGLEKLDEKENFFVRFLGDSFISECVCHLDALVTEKCKDHKITRGLVGVFLTPIFFFTLGTALWTEYSLKGLYLIFIKSIEHLSAKTSLGALYALGSIGKGVVFIGCAPLFSFVTKLSIIGRHLEHGVTPLVKRMIEAVKPTSKVATKA